MVGARTVRLMEESSRFPMDACAAARSRVACRWGILPITCVTCLGVGSVWGWGAASILILACDYQTRTCVELTFTPTVIFASFYVQTTFYGVYKVSYNSVYNCLVYCKCIYVYLYCDKLYTKMRVHRLTT